MRHELQAFRQAARSLARTPGFTAVAVLTLALGIGANTALYAVLDTVLLEPLPYPEPARLVRLHHLDVEAGVTSGHFSPDDFEDVAAATQQLDSLGAYFFDADDAGITLQGEHEPMSLTATHVSAGFFPALGVAPRLGRPLLAEDNVPGRDRVVVISSRLWERQFGSDRDIIGRELRLAEESFTVVGVAAPDLDYPSPSVDAWLPLSLIGEDDIPRHRSLRWLDVIARLAPESTLSSARQELDRLLASLAEAHPDTNEGWTQGRIVPLRESIVGDVRPALVTLAAAVGLVLLIACANLANLLLARGAGRRNDLAVRSALGAQRSALVGQLFRESLLLALAGGLAGLLIGYLGLGLLLKLAAERLPRADAITLDAEMFAFAFGIAVVSALLFGLMPALRLARSADAQALREGGRRNTAGRSPIRAALVVGQTALAALLLVGAGLLIRSLWLLAVVDPGFETERLLVASLSYPEMPPEARVERRERLLAALAALPGVAAVGAAKTTPLTGGGEPWEMTLASAPEQPVRPQGGGFVVSPGYFSALRIPVHAGREFEAASRTTGYPVIVSAALAEQLWPNGDAVGEVVQMFGLDLTVQAVVGDVRVNGLSQPPLPAVYLPNWLAQRSALKVFVRTEGDPATVAGAVRATIRDLEPDLPIQALAPMDELVAETLGRPRLIATLLTLLGALAVTISLIGLYGVISFLVNQRVRELGIRMALGADRARVLRMVLGWTVRLAGAGIALGLATAQLLAPALSSQLYAVTPRDPAVLGVVALLLSLGAIVAGWFPALRASAVQPISALRDE